MTSESWTPRNETERAIAEYNVNHVQTEALRKLVPDSGAYLNEVCQFQLRFCLGGESADEIGILG